MSTNTYGGVRCRETITRRSIIVGSGAAAKVGTSPLIGSSGLAGSVSFAAANGASAAQTAEPASARLPRLAPARWIWYPSGRTLANTFVLFRRELNLPAKPVRATGWIAADSRYLLEVNGRRIQWGPAPSDPRWVEADPVDLTGSLQAGPNVVGATVLYYGHGDGTWPAGKPGFLFRLEMEDAGGARTVIASGADWRALLCRAWPAGQYKRWFLRALQEEFDARRYPHGWTAPGFALTPDWLPAMELGGSPNKPPILTGYYEYASGVRTGPPESEVRPRSIPLLLEPLVPVRRLAEAFWVEWLRPAEEYFECRPPNAFKTEVNTAVTPAGEGAWQVTLNDGRAAVLTFELSEQVVGFPYFTVEAPAGTVVEALFHEAHQPGGPFPLLNTHFDSWTRLICREGVNEFECFDYESLRWLQLVIRNCRGTVTVRRVGVRRRMYPWPHEPVVRIEEAPLQRLFDASVNTLHNSAQDIIVDGMGRERQQYSGDCGHQLRAIHWAFGETRSPARFLRTYSDGQGPEGYFLDCWPAYDRLARLAQRHLGLFHMGPIIDHGVQLNFDLWQHYMFSGDMALLRELYPRMVRFSRYLESLVGRGGDGLLPVEDLGAPYVWMDYEAYQQRSGVAPPYTQRHKQCSFNLYTSAMFRHALAPICRAAGDQARAREVETIAARLLAAAVKRFWSPRDGLFVNNLPWIAEEKKVSLCDRSLATSILFDQCPGGNTRAAVAALAECPREMGLSYPANAGWRLWALAKAGRADVIVKDLRTRWATMDSVRLNNSLQEQWRSRPDSGSQWSHCALAPLYILYEGLAGIRPLEPGCTRVELRPQLADLPKLDLIARTVRGPIHFRAAGRLGGRELSIGLPPGCSGELLLPRGERVDLAPLAGTAPEGCVRYALPAGKAVMLRLTRV